MSPRFVQVSPVTRNATNSTAFSSQAEHHDEHCAYHDMVPGLRVQSIVSKPCCLMLCTIIDMMHMLLFEYPHYLLGEGIACGSNSDYMCGHGMTHVAGHVAWQANAEVVRGAMKSPQASVRQCAMRVFKLLGGETLPDTRQPPVATSAAAAPDLMGGLFGEADASAAAAPPPVFLGE